VDSSEIFVEASMLKKLMITTAAAALLTGSALAQSPPTSSPAPAARVEASGKFITEQTADQFLATKFKGTDVMGANNEKIGDVADLLFDKDNRILAYVISVGGFLGIGAKDVALTPATFKILPPTDRENMKLQLSMTKDELKAAPEFKPYNPPRTAAGGSGSAPTTGQGPRERAPVTAPPVTAPPPAQR